MKKLFNLKLLYASGLALMLLGSCSQMWSTRSAFFSKLGDWDDGSGQISTDDYFYITVTNRNMKYMFYETVGGPGTHCKIKKTDNSDEDIFCMLEIMERDLWAQSIQLEYNVPAGMCNYLNMVVPWHFNQNSGIGPSNIYGCQREQISTSIIITDDANTPDTEDIYCLCNPNESNIDCSTSNPPVCSSYSSSEVCHTTIQNLCEYNKEDIDGLANCCFGHYNIIGVDSADDETDWGGDMKTCIGGLGRVNWESYNKRGEPISKVTDVFEEGEAGSYIVPAIHSFFDGRHIIGNGVDSFPTANYYTDIEDPNNNTDHQPDFYQASNKQNNKTLYNHSPYPATGYPYITWYCEDRGQDHRHRIHVIIREWNSEGEFIEFKNTKGNSGDSDLKGLEGDGCDYYESSLGIPFDCNDLTDADDWQDLNEGKNIYPLIFYKN